MINLISSDELLMKFTNMFSSFGHELPMTIVVLSSLNCSIKSNELSRSKIETTLSKRVSPETFTLVKPML